MNKIEPAVYLTEHIRRCEQAAIENNCHAETLMQRAGQAAFRVLRQEFPKVQRLLIFCGSGNNAGDGYVLGQLANRHGYDVLIYQLKPAEALPEPARQMAIAAEAAGVVCQLWDEDAIENDVELIVDALFGIGLNTRIREPFQTAVNQINESGIPVLSLDMPSGLHSDTGEVLGVCVKAQATVTFIGKKIGMMMLDGPDVCGKIIVDDLGLAPVLNEIKPAARLLYPNIRTYLPPRLKNTHKGCYGRILIIGGGEGMPGAPCLAAHAALRVGAGAVTIATSPAYEQYALARLPEAMIYGIENAASLQTLLNKADVCVVGPGLGESEWAKQLFHQVIAQQLPMVIDASALAILAEDPQTDDNWVLTPHPGEAAKLYGCLVREVQANRLFMVQALQKKYGGTMVLKGHGTLLCSGETVSLCAEGNPGMASAGMGDALSGVIAGLIGQGLSLDAAARVGVFIHAKAGDLAAQASGERGLLATDLLPWLRQLANHYV